MPLKIVVDNVIGHRPLPGILAGLLPAPMKHSDTALRLLAAGLVVGVAWRGRLCHFAAGLLTTYTGEKLLRGFRARLFRHVQRLSLAYHDTKGTSDSNYRIQYDSSSIQNIAVEGVIPFMASTFTLIAMIYVTARINWQLAPVPPAVSPLIFLASRTYRRRLRRQSREVKKLESSALSVVHEVLGAARV